MAPSVSRGRRTLKRPVVCAIVNGVSRRFGIAIRSHALLCALNLFVSAVECVSTKSILAVAKVGLKNDGIIVMIPNRDG